jgi:tripartite-type tricarboxylate transporter receptor subunit TctC
MQTVLTSLKTGLMALTFLCAFTGAALTQESYPTRPVNFIVPWPPGSTTDLGFRLLTKETEKHLGQPIVVVNKPGGGGTVGVSALASSKPDGYTIGQGPSGGFLVIKPYLEKIPYHPLKDLTYIVECAEPVFGVMVKADSPFKTFKDLIVYARQNPKKLTYGTNAPNSIANLIMEQIAKKEGVQITHIPFKGSAEYQTALLGGHVLFTAGEFNFSFLEGGQTRVLLLLGDKRPEDHPDIPLSKDLGYDVPCPVLDGVAGPKGLPEYITKKLEAAFTRGMNEPAYVKGMKELHLTIHHRNSKEYTDVVTANYEIFGKVLKDMGLIK